MSGRLLIAVKDDGDGALFAGHDGLFGELHEGTVAGRGSIKNDGRPPASIGEGEIVLSARIGDRDMAEVMLAPTPASIGVSAEKGVPETDTPFSLNYLQSHQVFQLFVFSNRH